MTSLTAEETELVEAFQDHSYIPDCLESRLLAIISRLDSELDRHKRALEKCKEQRDRNLVDYMDAEGLTEFIDPLNHKFDDEEIAKILEGAGE